MQMKRNLFNLMIRMVDNTIKRNKKTFPDDTINISGLSIQPKSLFIWDCINLKDKKKSKIDKEKYLALTFTYPIKNDSFYYKDIQLQRPVNESFVSTRNRLNAKLMKLIKKVSKNNQDKETVIDSEVYFNPENQTIMDDVCLKIF
ncbi:Hypothetical protein SRAE_2000302600 [Strongyloides ratti]|uniref:Uncharacterized protein n=1 Tax=Strongyloides ratti TaxID=34506 RepID=A0A090MZ60_STRRB|nr:Hypothetical protein SRAE_2000302600 [Strongyloides ratti]CEF68369.1 Hypothetical protein SRAE_2000302600 [Strongyloides ratti]